MNVGKVILGKVNVGIVRSGFVVGVAGLDGLYMLAVGVVVDVVDFVVAGLKKLLIALAPLNKSESKPVDKLPSKEGTGAKMLPLPAKAGEPMLMPDIKPLVE